MLHKIKRLVFGASLLTGVVLLTYLLLVAHSAGIP
jgi:hypothetical protein